MNDTEIQSLAQCAAVDAVVRLTREMIRLGGLPNPPFVAAVASVTAEKLVADLDLAVPLDGHQARQVCETMLVTLLGALVGAAREQARGFAELVRRLAPPEPSGPPA